MTEPDNTPGPAEQLARAFATCGAVVGVIGLLADIAPLVWLAVLYEVAAAYYLADRR